MSAGIKGMIFVLKNFKKADGAISATRSLTTKTLKRVRTARKTTVLQEIHMLGGGALERAGIELLESIPRTIPGSIIKSKIRQTIGQVTCQNISSSKNLGQVFQVKFQGQRTNWLLVYTKDALQGGEAMLFKDTLARAGGSSFLHDRQILQAFKIAFKEIANRTKGSYFTYLNP